MLTRLKAHLDDHGVEYVVDTHRPTVTAMEAAHVERVSAWEHAKVVVVVVNDRPALAVLRASDRLDPRAVPPRGARLATEAEMAAWFPGCEVGAVPPFGRLFGVPVHVDRRLAADPWVSFLAGSHLESVRMRFVDFERLASPTLGDYAVVPDEE
jgi:Ala-tRNA(Pro) deacylase